MIKSTFNITAPADSVQAPHLIICAGMKGISFIEWDKETNSFLSVLVYHFPKQFSKNEVVAAIDEILQSEALLQKHFIKTEIVWTCAESILVPNAYFERSVREETLGIVYGGLKDAAIKDELVLKHQLHNVYAVPAKIENRITQMFPYAIQTHHAGLIVDFEPNEKDLLYCHFNTDSLTIMLRKQGQLQVIQNFEFNIPEDVVYHILNLCRNFDADAAEAVVTVSGMIDEKSNLYKELYKYVGAIRFYELPVKHNYAEALKEYPAHYFSHLFALASCVL